MSAFYLSKLFIRLCYDTIFLIHAFKVHLLGYAIKFCHNFNARFTTLLKFGI